MHTRADTPTRHERDEVVTDDQQVRSDGVVQAARLIALVTGAAVTLVGLIALLQIDWGVAEATTPVVDVAGLSFMPVSAVVTTVLGLLLIGAASVHDGDARLAMGAIFAAIGLAIVILDGVQSSWALEQAHGWAALVVGLVFVVTGLVSDGRYLVHRRRSTSVAARTD